MVTGTRPMRTRGGKRELRRRKRLERNEQDSNGRCFQSRQHQECEESMTTSTMRRPANDYITAWDILSSRPGTTNYQCCVCQETVRQERAVHELSVATCLEDHDEWILCHGCGRAAHGDCCQPEFCNHCRHCQMGSRDREHVSCFSSCMSLLPSICAHRVLQWLFRL